MKNLKGDLLTVKKGYICHQVNVDGKMGAGIALQIRNKWPEVYKEYKTLCNKYDAKKSELLGQTQLIPIDKHFGIINLFGQYLYINDRPTRYDAVVDAVVGMSRAHKYLEKGKNLYIPKLMGCALGGGEWPVYLAIVTHYLPLVNVVEYEPGKEVYDPDKDCEFEGMSIINYE